MSNVSKSEELNEANRYFGGDDKPINLAETTGHFKLTLTKVRKFSNITDETNLQLNETPVATPVVKAAEKTVEKKDVKKDEKKVTTSAAQTTTATKTKEEESKDPKAANNCAITEGGKQVTNHVQ